MKDIKAMSTSAIMSYLDAITVMDEEIDRAVRVVWNCFTLEGINELEKDEVLETLKKDATLIEPVRLKLVKEITRRFKHNFDLSKGPFEVKLTIQQMVTKYPRLGLTDVEVKADIVRVDRERELREKTKHNLSKA